MMMASLRHRLLLLLFFLLLRAAPAGAATTTLDLRSLSAVDSRAVCTDGSPAKYYFSAAAATADATAASTWIVHLEGGGWCYDQASCAKRCPEGTSAPLCSSNVYAPTRALQGVFHADDATLRAANKVFVPYCSSDGHMGSNEKNPSEGYRFRGAIILQAILRDLVTTQGLAAEGTAHTIVWGGASAGARGAMVHLDFVAGMVATAGGDASALHVLGFLDSPLWIDLPSINPAFPGFSVTTAGVFSQVNVTHVGAECARMHTGADGWKCIFAQYRMPFLTNTPYLVVGSQDDLFQIDEDMGHAPRSQSEFAYASNFATQTRQLVHSLHAADPSHHAVFSWACFNHAVSMSDSGFNRLTTMGGETMNGALVQFLRANGWGGGGASASRGDLAWVDTCDGWQCGKCSSSMTASATAQTRVENEAPAAVLPPWPHTYEMAKSTIMMPCNNSGWMDPGFAGKWGLVDFDWSNAKDLWVNAKPMDCQERLVTQVEQVKRVNPNTRAFVYRNLVKALPWYTSVREKLDNPAFSGWFIKYRDGINGTGYTSKPCTGGKCSVFYHDQDQTPEHPRGDGSCTDACDCGQQPCGEYLWDHRNGSSLRQFLIEEFVLGPDGLGHEDVSGVFLDDAWADAPEPHAPWWPKEGFCSGGPIGGPTEEFPNCTQDMGLTQRDTTALKQEWATTIAKLRLAIVARGKFNWQMFTQSTDLPASTATCMAYFADACRPEGGKRYNVPWVYQFTDPKKGRNLPKVKEDLATFLLARGDYAWIGYGWIGCAPQVEYYRPPALDVEYGAPVGTCKADGGGRFVREYTKATVSFHCHTMEAEIAILHEHSTFNTYEKMKKGKRQR